MESELDSSAYVVSSYDGGLLLHGHTHLSAWEPLGNDSLYLNPGSVSLPKESSPHSYMILDEREAIWKDLNGCVYHSLKP